MINLVERNFQQVQNRQRWLAVIQHTGTLGAILALLYLLLGAAMLKGWIEEPAPTRWVVFLVACLATIVWAGFTAVVVHLNSERRWLASTLEQGHPELLDRVNTLVALEDDRGKRAIAPFYRCILNQAQSVLLRRSLVISLSARRALLHLGVCILAIEAAVWFYQRYDPWQRLQETYAARHPAPTSTATNQPADSQTLELAAPAKTNQVDRPWGEVRITEPGRDLEATKVEVVPLQIEAAASQDLAQVAWLFSVNGSPEKRQELPPSQEPRYAVYHPTLFLDELKLSDWDVVSYYAEASTRNSNSFASEIYFLEVHPFREDLPKMADGLTSSTPPWLGELASLINQQQQVIRQTHQLLQQPPGSFEKLNQDRNQIAHNEADLAKAVAHLKAQMAIALENESLAETSEHLSKAAAAVKNASELVRYSGISDGLKQEKTGLAELVAARRKSQALAGIPPPELAGHEDNPASTARNRTLLKDISEFRNEEKAVQDFLQKLTQQQKTLALRSAPRMVSTNSQNLSREEGNIRQSLADFQGQHPAIFKPAEKELEAADRSLEQCTQALAKKAPTALSQANAATGDLDKLSNAIQQHSQSQRLADAYRLEKMLEQQAARFGQCRNSGAPGSPSQSEMRQAAASTRETLNQLQQLAGQQPLSEAFGPPLREALGEKPRAALEEKLSQVEKAVSPGARQEPAGQVQQGLLKVCEAFEQSLPKAMRIAKDAAQSQPSQADGLQQGLAQLGSLLRQLESQRPVSPEDREKQRREAYFNLQNALRALAPAQPTAVVLSRELDQDLKSGEKAFDAEVLKRLMAALEKFNRELRAEPENRAVKPEVTGLEAGRMPAAYRGRVEKYFQKLSEK